MSNTKIIKAAINAGHILATPGKRMPKELDANETREWVFNDGVVKTLFAEMTKFQGVACQYYDDPYDKGVTDDTVMILRRFDDHHGKENIDIDTHDGVVGRVDRANAWGADYYLSVHHNAAGVVFSGGGPVMYIYQNGGEGEALARTLYAAITDELGYKGNRATPISPSNLYEARKTDAPAVLLECLFMDSTKDAKIILEPGYYDRMGKAIAAALRDYLGLKIKEGFQDVEKGRYYTDPVNWGVKNGIIEGRDPLTFDPDGVCTRAEAITFVWRMAGCPEAGMDAPISFEDVNMDSFYGAALDWAWQSGIVRGLTETAFGPGEPVTRGQFVTMLYRLAGCPVMEDGVEETPFEDLDKNAFYYDAVVWACREAITMGTTPTTFEPDAPLTRAMTATMVYRYKNT